ncbi:hypothetical protein TNCT_371161 [Trichonephila clavata]|uniref:Uncharacterized protein n=1 Tax=Trichonephila clavata TaxID=2740835 RepID=A0A8X6JAG6_TRICU|nr:hypothetical protein TNCT_371161 [Trichonephila clavata]
MEMEPNQRGLRTGKENCFKTFALRQHRDSQFRVLIWSSPGTDERGLLISVGATAPKETSAPLSLRSNDEMIGRRWSNDKPRDRCRGGSAGCQGATARGFGWRIW